jgi:hypothetical protein
MKVNNIIVVAIFGYKKPKNLIKILDRYILLVYNNFVIWLLNTKFKLGGKRKGYNGTNL